MNPLNHFGIKSRMIRRDLKSYNNKKSPGRCPQCGKPLMWDLAAGMVSTDEDGPEYKEYPVTVCTNESCDYEDYPGAI